MKPGFTRVENRLARFLIYRVRLQADLFSRSGVVVVLAIQLNNNKKGKQLESCTQEEQVMTLMVLTKRFLVVRVWTPVLVCCANFAGVEKTLSV